MALIRLLLILLLLGAGLFLLLQNQGLLVTMLLGTPMQPLPLGVLLLLSILFGFGMGILLLFLLRRKAPSASSGAFRRPQSRKTKTKNSFKSPFRSPPQSKSSPSRSSDSTQRLGSDWYDAPAQDWAGTPTRAAAQKSAARSPQATDREIDREPYPNRFAKDEPPDAFERSRKESSSDRVVDADYRVLRQPHSPPPSDEEWDDEFFQDDR
jgi:Zn-dependent protease with chaperone function